MNKDFRVEITIATHYKTKKLMRKLGDRSFYNLIRLWAFAAANKPNGDLSGMDEEDIEIAADWNGECSIFTLALLELKFIDKKDNIYSIHNWENHNGYAFHAPARVERAKKAAKTRWGKHNEKKDLILTDATSIALSNSKQCPLPTPTPTPSPKKTNKEITSFKKNEGQKEKDFYLTKKKKKLSGKRLETFMQFWDAFDYKSGKAEASDIWLEFPPLTNTVVDKIITAAKKEALSRPELILNKKTPKMAQGWLSGRRWEDETSTKQDPSNTTEILTKEAIDELNK